MLALAGWLLVAAALAWLLVRCLRDGRFYTRSGPDIERAKKPIAFWVNVVVLGVAIVMMIGTSVYVVLQ